MSCPPPRVDPASQRSEEVGRLISWTNERTAFARLYRSPTVDPSPVAVALEALSTLLSAASWARSFPLLHFSQGPAYEKASEGHFSRWIRYSPHLFSYFSRRVPRVLYKLARRRKICKAAKIRWSLKSHCTRPSVPKTSFSSRRSLQQGDLHTGEDLTHSLTRKDTFPREE